MLYIAFSIGLFLSWGLVFSLFPETKAGSITKWLFAGILTFFFWKETLEQGPEIIIPVIFTITIFLALLFFPLFKRFYTNLIKRLINNKND